MTGYDIYKRCMALMGLTISDGEVISDHALISRFTEILNQIALDLKLPNISSLSEQITLTPAKADAVCYGAAMLLSFSEGDIAKNQFFTNIYNSKRNTALSEISNITDVIPGVDSGGV